MITKGDKEKWKLKIIQVMRLSFQFNSWIKEPLGKTYLGSWKQLFWPSSNLTFSLFQQASVTLTNKLLFDWNMQSWFKLSLLFVYFVVNIKKLISGRYWEILLTNPCFSKSQHLYLNQHTIVWDEVIYEKIICNLCHSFHDLQ